MEYIPLPSTHQPSAAFAESPVTPALSLRIVTDFHELQSLAPDWQHLLDQSASAEPMCGPNWLLPWWRIYRGSRSLQVGLFHDGDRLVGLAPMCKRRVWYRPGIPMTRLEFLGSDMDEPEGVCSEYLNLIARVGHEERVVQGFARGVATGSFGAWDELVLAAMNGTDGMPDQLLDAFRLLGFAGDKQMGMEAPFVPLPESWDAYLKSMSSNKRRYLNVSMRDFETWAGNDWRIESATTPESLAKGRAILHELHNHRWQEAEGLAGAFTRPRFAEFHNTVMAKLLEEGALDLFWITVRGEPMAIYYQIRANGKLYFYQSGRKLDVPAAVRPGIVITIQAIKRAIEQGLREFDFLGGASQYKMQFTKLVRPLVQVRVARGSPREWLRLRAEDALAWARRLRHTVRQWRAKPLAPGLGGTEAVNKS